MGPTIAREEGGGVASAQRHRVVSLTGRGGSGARAPDARGAPGTRGGPRGPEATRAGNPNFAPRAAWPDGTFTIRYPAGYDPSARAFDLRAAASAGARRSPSRVVVTKRPAEERARTAALRAASEAARSAALDALDLDEADAERVDALYRRQAANAREERKRKQRLHFLHTSADGKSADARDPDPDPDPSSDVPKDFERTSNGQATSSPGAPARTLGVDAAYARRAAEAEARRRDLRDARRAAKKRSALRPSLSADDDERAATTSAATRTATDAEYDAAYAAESRERDRLRAKIAAARKEAARRSAEEERGGGERRKRVRR